MIETSFGMGIVLIVLSMMTVFAVAVAVDEWRRGKRK